MAKVTTLEEQLRREADAEFAPYVLERFRAQGAFLNASGEQKVRNSLGNLASSLGRRGVKTSLDDPTYMVLAALKQNGQLDADNFEKAVDIALAGSGGEKARQKFINMSRVVSSSGLQTAEELSKAGRLDDRVFVTSFSSVVDGAKKRIEDHANRHLQPGAPNRTRINPAGSDAIGVSIAKVAVPASNGHGSDVYTSLADPVYSVVSSLAGANELSVQSFTQAMEVASRKTGAERDALIQMPKAVANLKASSRGINADSLAAEVQALHALHMKDLGKRSEELAERTARHAMRSSKGELRSGHDYDKTLKFLMASPQATLAYAMADAAGVTTEELERRAGAKGDYTAFVQYVVDESVNKDKGRFSGRAGEVEELLDLQNTEWRMLRLARAVSLIRGETKGFSGNQVRTYSQLSNPADCLLDGVVLESHRRPFLEHLIGIAETKEHFDKIGFWVTSSIGGRPPLQELEVSLVKKAHQKGIKLSWE